MQQCVGYQPREAGCDCSSEIVQPRAVPPKLTFDDLADLKEMPVLQWVSEQRETS